MPTTSVSRLIAAPQQKVWAVLADIANAGRWNTAWSHIEITSSQREGSGTTFRAHTDDGHSFDFQITHWVPPEYIAFAPIGREESERYAITLESQVFRLHPAGDDSTRVELIASARSHGIRGRFIGLFLWPGYQKHGLNSALDALQALLERAEEDNSDPEAKTSSAAE